MTDQSSSYGPITYDLAEAYMTSLSKTKHPKTREEILISAKQLQQAESALDGTPKSPLDNKVAENLYGDPHGGIKPPGYKSGGVIVGAEEEQLEKLQKQKDSSSKNQSAPTSPKLGT